MSAEAKAEAILASEDPAVRVSGPQTKPSPSLVALGMQALADELSRLHPDLAFETNGSDPAGAVASDREALRDRAKRLTGYRPLLLRRTDAAAACAMSLDSFERYVESEIRLVICGRMKLVPYEELERYVAENAVRVGGVL